MRLLLHSAAYVLLDTLRRAVLGHPVGLRHDGNAQLRFSNLLPACTKCKERITIALPSSCPVAPVLRRCLTLLGYVRLRPQAFVERNRHLRRNKCKTVVVSKEAAQTRCA